MALSAIPLSVFIIAKDEADRIGETIKSVIGFADEVIVVDSGSNDDTVAVSERCGARVIHQEFLGYGQQKRFAEDACRNDWVLNIDADEPLTKTAQSEVSTLIATGDVLRFQCWRIPIKTVFPHEEEPAPWAYNYNQIRLYDRQKSRFSTSSVHDSVLPGDGATIGQLTGAIAHRSHRDINFQVEKFNRYTQMQVADLVAKRRRLPRWRLVSEFPLSFLKAYLIRRYFRYGFWGVSLSISYAYSRFLRVAKFHEQELTKKHK